MAHSTVHLNPHDNPLRLASWRTKGQVAGVDFAGLSNLDRLRGWLMPLFGAVSAMLAFILASPFESTLDRPGMTLADPAAQYTYGTRWGDVNRLAFGALLCASLCFWLTIGRRSSIRVILVTLAGGILGAAANYATDSGSDIIGLHLSASSGPIGNIVAGLAWCVLVPAGISATILLAVGPTAERARRAASAALWSGVGAFLVQVVVGTVASQVFGGGGDSSLRSFLPVWCTQEIAIGIVFGIAMAVADQLVRRGSVRLILGRNEWREWSLDHPVNRIGSAEGVEIPVGRISGVLPVHAAIFRQGDAFGLAVQAGSVFVNGAPAQQVPLHNGDTISVGTATLRFLTAGPRTVPTSTVVHATAAAPLGVVLTKGGEKFQLLVGEHGIGRDPDNTICLNGESSVSRHHAKVAVTSSGTLISDLGSTNGTKVNGQRITQPTLLHPGDQIAIGAVHLGLEIGSTF
jgi:pSer/pThr/pTyr-binding forkhead associated (FHA) protein